MYFWKSCSSDVSRASMFWCLRYSSRYSAKSSSHATRFSWLRMRYMGRALSFATLPVLKAVSISCVSSRWCLGLIFWASLASSGAFTAVRISCLALVSIRLNCLKPSYPLIGRRSGSSSSLSILRNSHVMSL